MKFVSSRQLPELPFRNRPEARRDRVHHPRKFGDALTADHKVLNDENGSRLQHRYAVAVQGLYFCWTQSQSYPTKKKTAQETVKRLQGFAPPDQKPRIIHASNCLHFISACEDLCWDLDRSTPYYSLENGIDENAVRREKEGTSALRVQSDLSENWWREAMESYCYLRKIQDKLADRKSSCERRCGTPFDGPVMPFRAEID